MEKSPSILFVEDNQQIADQVIKAGVHYKWNIDWVTTRDGAVEKALSGKFDVLILDRMLGAHHPIIWCRMNRSTAREHSRSQGGRP